ncbi:glycoside hydrolase family 16 protein [Nocardioides sp.]|uniref:glycoside hydrolase family 16 protein n=1 Tax=Nocardioides sp. TaxID=35761 RepID=UPI0027356279|nr:glycoside hydrolase family 16 protein [Nocardioides sp.]MDP3889730.1 glycoside hydrolase family 16 protein [Nocardioides sp.]
MTRPSPRRSSSIVLAAAAVLLGGLLVPVGLTASSAAPPPDCGGVLSKSTGGVWKCTFVDHFSGQSVDTEKWIALETRRTGGRKEECRVDSPHNIAVADGTLRLTVREEAEPFVCESPTGDYTTRYTAGGVTSATRFSQTYGRFEIRAKFPSAKVQGLHSALWMWPQERRYGDLSGEIDIAEFRTLGHDRVVPTVHYRDDGTDANKTNWWCYVENADQFHTYAVEWTPETMTFLYDGQVCLVNRWSPAAPLKRPQPFDEPYFLIMNQSLGEYLNAFDPAITPLPATMEIDYVKVWR